MSLRPRVTVTQHQGHRLQTGPAIEPVSLDEALELIISPPVEEENFIDNCITDARIIFEAATGIACIDQTWRLTLDRWPTQADPWWDGVREMAVSELYSSDRGPEYVTLPRYPLQSITSMVTYDQSDTQGAITVATVFNVDTESFPGRVALRAGQSWPTALRQRNAIEIDYVAGFGTAATDVPRNIRRAILNMTNFLYENRGVGCGSGQVMSASGAWELASEYVNTRI